LIAKNKVQIRIVLNGCVSHHCSRRSSRTQYLPLFINTLFWGISLCQYLPFTLNKLRTHFDTKDQWHLLF